MDNRNDHKHKHPALSVITPVYNVEDYLREALDSVRNQSFRDVEFIAINDGSEDNSPEILAEFEKKDERFRIYHQENAGISATRNTGLDKANGKVIYFFDSDDVLMKDTFQKVMNRMQATGSELGYIPSLLMNQYGEVKVGPNRKNGLNLKTPISGEQFLQTMISKNLYGTNVQKYFFDRSFLLKNNLRFDEGYIHEDEGFMLEAVCRAQRVISFKEPMLKKRLRPNSIMSAEKGIKNVKGWAKAISRMLSFMEKQTLTDETNAIILDRARTLAHNCLNILNELNQTNKQKHSLNDFLRTEELDRLGLFVNVHRKSQFVYRILRKMQRSI